MELERSISGWLTGADRGALAAAKAASVATGDWMPRGFRAQDGPHPEFAKLYEMREHASDRYPPRTALNVKESDATLRFATDWHSPGEVLTLAMCERYGRPHFEVTPGAEPTPEAVAEWLVANGSSTSPATPSAPRPASGRSSRSS
jgi:hypothetical protein